MPDKIKTRTFTVSIETNLGLHIGTIRIIGRGQTWMEQRQDAQKQARAFLSSLTYRIEG